MMIPVLYISERHAQKHQIASSLQTEGFTVFTSSPMHALRMLLAHDHPYVILIDAHLPAVALQTIIERFMTSLEIILNLSFALLQSSGEPLPDAIATLMGYLDITRIEWRPGWGGLSREITKLALLL